MVIAARVVDYYAEVGVRDRLILAAGASSTAPTKGEDQLLACSFEPSVLLRIPATDHLGVSFAPEVAMFCFAHGIRLVTPDEAAANAIPVVTSFVLTAADKSRMYGACIVWYEQLAVETVTTFLEDVDSVSPTQDGEDCMPQRDTPRVHAPEAICLLSRVAVFDALMDSCRQLFRMRLACKGPLPPAALHALLNTPMPAFNCSTRISLGNVSIPVSTPAANQLPHTMAGRDFLQLFQALDVSNVIMLWALMLAEQKVVLQGKQPHVLTMAAETLSALLFPFNWQHVYIPILPMRLLDILQAPVPFLIGIDEEILNFAERQQMIPDDVVQVDLDQNAILCDATLASRLTLPQRQYHKLYKALVPFCRPSNANDPRSNASSAFPMAPPPDMVLDDSRIRVTLAEMSDDAVAVAIDAIKSAFLRFMTSIMAKYQELMIVPPAEIQLPAAIDFFDYKRWESRFSRDCTEWLQMFTTTQAFTQFLEVVAHAIFACEHANRAPSPAY